MEVVGDRDDDGGEARVGQHGPVIGVGDSRLMDGDHPLAKILGRVTDRVQFRVFGLPAGIEVHELGDRSTAQDADAHGSLIGTAHDRGLVSWTMAMVPDSSARPGRSYTDLP